MIPELEDEFINQVAWSDFFAYAERIKKKLEDSQFQKSESKPIAR